MKTAVLGALIGAGLVGLVMSWGDRTPEAFAQRSAGREGQPAGGGLIALNGATNDDRQQITVIDPDSRVVCVYHIERRSGEIVLKSVRNITWDLQMLEFNSGKPAPNEIRSIIQRR